MKLFPVPKDDPPVGAAYQFNIPALAVAPKVTVPIPQRLPGVVLVIDGTGFTVAITADLVAVVQPLLEAST